jgi:hypothetical protein
MRKQTPLIACGPVVRAALEEAVEAIDAKQIIGTFAHPLTGGGTQIKVFIGERTPESLKPRNPVRNRNRGMRKAYEELLRNLETWHPLSA